MTNDYLPTHNISTPIPVSNTTINLLSSPAPSSISNPRAMARDSNFGDLGLISQDSKSTSSIIQRTLASPLPPPPPNIPPGSSNSDPIGGPMDNDNFSRFNINDIIAPEPHLHLPSAKILAERYKFDLEGSKADRIIFTLMSRLEQNYRLPDLEAVFVALGFLGAYRLNLHNPPWFHIVGGSSAGKTTVVLENCLEGVFPDHYAAGALTPSSLISGLTKGDKSGANNSLLIKLGPRHLVMFKDWTNLMSMREEVIKSVAGTFREVYDGHTNKPFGTGKTVDWRGNWSVITAMTPAVEQDWVVMNPAGERFLICRYRSPEVEIDDVDEIAVRAMTMEYRGADGKRGNDPTHSEPYRELVRELVNDKLSGHDDPELGEPTEPALPTIQQINEWGLWQMAKMLTTVRTIPTKENNWGKAGYVSSYEGTGRVSKQLINLCLGLASLRRKPSLDQSDVQLMRRIAYDTIPFQKKWIIDSLMQEQLFNGRARNGMHEQELYARTAFRDRQTFSKHLHDLYVLEVIEKRDEKRNMWGFNERFLKIYMRGLGWRL